MVIGQQKGRTTKENLARNFGCPNPEGYRKALRLMKMAEKFGMPVLCLIDTPGAYPGVGAEERHVAEAIAVNIREMSNLRVPIIATVIGEGGSGGALGIAVADRVLILQNAYYSVISPEGCAAILWKGPFALGPARLKRSRSRRTNSWSWASWTKSLTSPLGGAHTDRETTGENFRAVLKRQLDEVSGLSQEKMLDARYDKFRKMGVFCRGVSCLLVYRVVSVRHNWVVRF